MPYELLDISDRLARVDVDGLKALSGYIRVSRVGGRRGESFIAPEVQLDALFDGCPAGYYVARVYRELDESGANELRDGWLAARNDVANGTSTGVIVAKSDRFSRDVEHGVSASREIYRNDGWLFIPLEGITIGPDPDPQQEFLFVQMLAAAQLQLANIRRGWATTVKKATARGVYISGAAPTGYDRDAHGRLVPNETADAVKLIVARRAARPRHSWGAIVDELERSRWRPAWTPNAARFYAERGQNAEIRRQIAEMRGPDPLNPNKTWGEVAAWLQAETPVRPHWTHSTVARICGNRAYLGEIRYEGEEVDGRPPPFSIVLEDMHEAIVDADEFERANADAEPQVERSGELSDRVATRGVATCAGCGRTLKIGATTPRYGTNAGKRVALLTCRKRSGTGICPAPVTVTAELLDAYAFHVLRDGLAHRRERLSWQLVVSDEELEALREDAERKRSVYRDYASPANKEAVGDDDIWREHLQEAKQAWLAAKAEYERRKAAAEQGGPLALSGGDLLDLLDSGELTPLELRQLYTAAFAEFSVAKPPRRTNGHLPLDGRVSYRWR